MARSTWGLLAPTSAPTTSGPTRHRGESHRNMDGHSTSEAPPVKGNLFALEIQ